jgi:hypothetical protein
MCVKSLKFIEAEGQKMAQRSDGGALFVGWKRREDCRETHVAEGNARVTMWRSDATGSGGEVAADMTGKGRALLMLHTHKK